MQYGHFSKNQREYIITRPDTPSPWINYLSNPLGYCGIISQSGGGFSFYKDPKKRRITKYHYNSVPVDRPGRYFYIKDPDSGHYWSPTWQPVRQSLAAFQCHHGLGYTLIKSAYQDYEHEALYFVPLDHSCEIWRLRLNNNSSQTRRLHLYAYSEFTLWDEPESRNIQWSLHLPSASCQEEMLFYKFIESHPSFDREANTNYQPERPGFAFMGMNKPLADYECARDRFIGLYHSESDPVGLTKPCLENSLLSGGIGCGALRTELELPPGGSEEIIVLLGFSENREAGLETRRHLATPEAVAQSLENVKSYWREYLRTFTAQTPDQEFNAIVNVWNPYQCKTTFDWSRYISFYENGEGRGMGTRDSCQDLLAISSHLPARAEKRIMEILETTQFENGSCYHQFFPLGGKGDLKDFSDDHLWLIPMVYSYLAETGDFGLLEKAARYADSKRSASVYQHLLDALDYTASHTGEHGLPLILTADWNDTLHLWMAHDKPESVLVAAIYVYALKLMSRLASATGRERDAAKLLQRANEMSELVNNTCWDGAWYQRGFGRKIIGTQKNKEAKIFLTPQSWCVMSGIATGERARICMDSVKEYLASPEGVRLLWPPFTSYDNAHGLISRYVPGHKENGIFAHANAWAIIAETMLKRSTTAFDYYRKILPLSRNPQAEKLKTEPYVFCQTIASPEAHDCGEGANSWLTGTASWMYVAATQYILGIRPTLEGLLIHPCLPPAWNDFTLRRRFRGCLYTVRFHKTGTSSLKLNGKRQQEFVIPPQSASEVNVEVEW